MVRAEPTLAIDAVEIPDKLYFRIGEVSRILGVEPHVLRYWETEFPVLNPKKGRTGQRLYRRKDVATALEIKQLLYERRFTIEGARKHLGGRPKAEAKPAAPQRELFDPVRAALDDVRRELQEILGILK